MTQPSERLEKKPYEPPKLHVYGNLAEMTKSTGLIGKSDGGGKSRKHNTG
ncbi:MAG TPA: hypothetical protein VLX60_00885 [Terriglobales bacterium]|nr:hypothetical protein [Terriglobales bacterium]